MSISSFLVQAQDPIFQKDNPTQIVDYNYGITNNTGIAMNKNTGDIIVVWDAASRIYGKIFNGLGVQQGVQFQISTDINYNHHTASVAMNSSGDIIVSWTSEGQDGDNSGIYAQRLNSSGQKQGSEFLVNSTTTSSQTASSAGIDENGNFVITWTSYNQDGSGYGIYAQRYDNQGIAQGSEFQVNTYTTSDQNNSRIGMTSTGGFIITWNSYGQDGSNNGVYAQRFDANGGTVGGEFIVNTTTINDQSYPVIGINTSNDSFVISWTSAIQSGDTDVFAQRFASDASPLGTEFRVNTYITGYQSSPTIAVSENGHFVVFWTSYNQFGANSGFFCIGKLFDTDGTALSLESDVESPGAEELTPGVAMDRNGNFVLTWAINQSYYAYIQQSSDLILAPRFPAQETHVTNITSSSMTINWSGGDGNNRLVVMGRTVDGPTNIDYVPSNGGNYTANATFGLGDSGTGLGNFYMVYIGNENSVTVTGLTPATSYDYLIIEYNGTMPSECFLKSSIATGTASTTTVTSIEDEQDSAQIKLYPNPVNDHLQVETAGTMNFKMIDSNGKICINDLTIINNGTIDLSNLNPGIYCVQLSNEQSQFTRKIIVE